MQTKPMTPEERASFKHVVYAAEPGAPCPFVSGRTVLAAYDAGGHYCRSIWRFEEKFMREHKLTDSHWTLVLVAFINYLRECTDALKQEAQAVFTAAKSKVGLKWSELPGYFQQDLRDALSEMRNKPTSPLWTAPAIRVDLGAQLWHGYRILAT